jgi:multidrug efflux system membrane fusion protein
MRPIKVAQTEANVAMIDDGLKAGEQVVVDGQYKLQPGAHVELTTPQPQQPATSPQQPRSKLAKQ